MAYPGNRPTLIIGKVLKRFLFKKDVAVECVDTKFLKPKVESRNVLEGFPGHLLYIGNMPLKDIIAGPLTVTSHRSSYCVKLQDFEF